MKKLIPFITLFLISLTTFSNDSIINGSNTYSENSPAFYNTVALVKKDGKIFCTGSLIAKDLILTAKHCLVDKVSSDFHIYFGNNTNEIDYSLIREVDSFQTRHPLNWEMTFPSFDIAWVKFKGNHPSQFKVLDILPSEDELKTNEPILQVGYGNSSSINGKIIAGEKLFAKTNLKSFINNSRFFNILVFQGPEGTGSCHGDSGGPAYIKRGKKWYIIGVTNGFDPVLTPKAMFPTSDDEFPWNIDCSKNQSLYSFAGSHANWIEDSAKIILNNSEHFIEQDREASEDIKSISQWCHAKDFGSSSWNLLKVILDKKVDDLLRNQNSVEEFYNNCDRIIEYLNDLTAISLDSKNLMSDDLNLNLLSLLPSLERLKLYNFENRIIDINSGSLKELFISSSEFKELFINRTNLTTLKISSSNIKSNDFSNLNNLEAIELYNTNLLLNDFSHSKKNLRKFLSNKLETRVSTSLYPLLEVLSLSSVDTSLLDFSSESLLNELSLTRSKIKDLTFLKKLNQLKKLNLKMNQISNIEVLGSQAMRNLVSLNISNNPISDLSPLKDSLNLMRLVLFQTPLKTGKIPKSEDNCPSVNTGPALQKFCSK